MDLDNVDRSGVATSATDRCGFEVIELIVFVTDIVADCDFGGSAAAVVVVAIVGVDDDGAMA